MRAIVTLIDEKTGYIFQKDKLVEPYREQRDPQLCVTRYDFRFEFNIADLYFRDLLDKYDTDVKEKVEINACSECEFFSDSRFYADNSILVSWGSCMKCQRNMTTTNPYQETPTWCPLKGDEDDQSH